MNITGFDHGVAFTLVLAHAGVVAATDQATAAKNLFGVGVVARITDGGGQPSHLEITEPLELGPNLVGGLSHQIN